MSNRKSLIRFWAWSLALIGMITCSAVVHAESESEDVPIEEQPVIQDSITTEESPTESYDEPEPYEIPPSDIPEQVSFEMSEYQPESEPYDDSPYIDESQQETYDDEEEFSSSYDNPFPWAQESTDYYYEPEYSSSYYDDNNNYYYHDYSQPSSSSSYLEMSYEYEESHDEWYENETTESEEEEESSVVYHETSVDSSELTSKDWEELKNSLSSDMRLDNDDRKSSDAAIREIKDNTDLTGNDDIHYLTWGLILIGIGLVILAFIIYSTVYTKRRMAEKSASQAKKRKGSQLNIRDKTDKK